MSTVPMGVSETSFNILFDSFKSILSSTNLTKQPGIWTWPIPNDHRLKAPIQSPPPPSRGRGEGDQEVFFYVLQKINKLLKS